MISALPAIDAANDLHQNQRCRPRDSDPSSVHSDGLLAGGRLVRASLGPEEVWSEYDGLFRTCPREEGRAGRVPPRLTQRDWTGLRGDNTAVRSSVAAVISSRAGRHRRRELNHLSYYRVEEPGPYMVHNAGLYHSTTRSIQFIAQKPIERERHRHDALPADISPEALSANRDYYLHKAVVLVDFLETFCQHHAFTTYTPHETVGLLRCGGRDDSYE